MNQLEHDLIVGLSPAIGVEPRHEERRVAQQCVAVERRRGRPRKDDGDRLEPLSTSLAAEDYALLCRMARERGESLASLVRQIIESRLQRRQGDACRQQQN